MLFFYFREDLRISRRKWRRNKQVLPHLHRWTTFLIHLTWFLSYLRLVSFSNSSFKNEIPYCYLNYNQPCNSKSVFKNNLVSRNFFLFFQIKQCQVTWDLVLTLLRESARGWRLPWRWEEVKSWTLSVLSEVYKTLLEIFSQVMVLLSSPIFEYHYIV